MHKHKDKDEHKDKKIYKEETKERRIDKSTICKLINASIEEEAKAGHDYTEILEAIPTTEDYKECAEIITEILEDEINHSLALIRIGKQLECKPPDLNKEDEEMLGIVNHIHKIEID